jgi:hypothetical protein
LVSFLSWIITSTLLLWATGGGAGTAFGAGGKGPTTSPSTFHKEIDLIVINLKTEYANPESKSKTSIYRALIPS